MGKTSSCADITRRDFLTTLALVGGGACLAGCADCSRAEWVNDVHSRLTATRVRRILRPRGRAELLAQLRASLRHPHGISVAGGRHSMGAQAFGTDSIHFDLTGLDHVGDLDSTAGIVEVEPGVTWPKLMDSLDRFQQGGTSSWCIRQKQTGADQLTIGGAHASNIHGRGLAFAPFVQDIESFTLLTATGDEISCSRSENPDWFTLAIGGYGNFGVVTSLRIRLTRRQTLKRVVTLEKIDRIPSLVEQRICDGFLYGDFQFSCASETDGFLRDGVFSTYLPVEVALPADSAAKGISTDMWKTLITLAHVDKARAFNIYTDYYRRTDGQLYASDRQQMSTYLPDYHDVVAQAVKPAVEQSLVITELYVPRSRLNAFMESVRADFRHHNVDVVYGVVRWIEPDHETFLPWARDRMACVIFNLNVHHDAEGQAKAKSDFRRLIDRSLEQGGSFYLTYHRHATRRMVEAAYPRFAEWIEQKERRDPGLVWRSDWYQHMRRFT